MTLPVVGGVAALLWLVTPASLAESEFESGEYGLWRFVPEEMQKGYGALGWGVLCAALAVYMMVELNNKNLLLRVSSRMLGSMLGILLTVAVAYHAFQPGCVVMLLLQLSFFPLFASYQRPEPPLSFRSFLLLSLASLVFPKLVWLVPLFWQIQWFFRTLSFRSFLASLMAVFTVYWMFAGIAALMGGFPLFLEHVKAMVSFHPGDYQRLDYREVVTFFFLMLLFVIGTIDNYAHSYLDRVRTRIIYDAVCLMGGVVAVLICVQPQYADVLMPLLLMNTAMVFGHFFTLTHTRFSHICCLILALLAVAVWALQYVCDSQLRLFF